MEWDLKMPPWDFAELERDSDPSVGPVVVTRSVGGGGPAPPVNRVDCSVDLKLGGFGDLGPVKSRWPRPQQQQSQSQPQPPSPLTSVMPSSGTLKRPRALSSGTQSASCLVDGCDADLSKCREYHRRHKVCELHSKTPAVMVGGREQRFCQQCSRFHLLVEFDEVKRSCRKRLDGHNRRRRKPQPNSLNSVNLFPNHQGSMFSVSSQLFPVSAPEQSWAGIKSDILYQHSTSPQFTERELCFGNSYIFNKEGKQIPFLQKRDTALTNRNMLGTFQTPLTTISLSGSNSNGSNEMSSHGVTPVFRSNSALSLLSSPTPTSSINISYLVPPCPADQIPMGQPIVSNLQHTDAVHHSPPAASECLSSTGFPCPVIEDGAIFVSGDNASNTRCQSIFHAGVEGSSDGTLQMLPFSWN